MRYLKFVFACLLLSASFNSDAQYRIIGFVYDQAEEPYIANEVRLTGDTVKMITQTDPEGRFEFHDIPRGEYTVVVITDYGILRRPVNVRTSLELHLQRPRNIKMDEVVVSAVRAEEVAPIPSVTLDKEQIEKRNLGQDVPFVLKWTPSVVTTSDAGTGIGYTGIRVRGTDPTRINVTINGVPLNDAESQGVFWVNMPDLMSSTQSIQIQRGVGESTFGTGAFGATVNLNTTETITDPYASISASGGSFGTYRGNIMFGSGLLANKFTIDGRLSTIQSDGYIDRASADLRSFYGSAAYVGSKTSVRFTAFGGNEVTYQAWNGVPAQYIDDPELRTFNPSGMEKEGEPYDNEVDDYSQTHYQLHVSQSIFTQLQGYLTAHYTKGKGFFEQYKSPDNFGSSFTEFLAQYGLENDDVIRRRWLDNDFYGVIAGLYFTDPSDKFTFRLSGGFNDYRGDHFGEVIWTATGSETSDLPYYYFNDSKKTAGNIFAKLNYNFSEKWSAMVDLQYRSVNYTFEGIDNDGSTLDQNEQLKFFNPKGAVTFRPTDGLSLQYYVGVANREPNRDDYQSSSAGSPPRSERLIDQEFIARYEASKWNLELVGYYMLYKDQLAITGELSDVGELLRVNIEDSYRLGLEVNAAYQPIDRLRVGVSGTFSQNRASEFTEFVDDWDTGTQIPIEHTDVPLAFSPGTILMGEVQYDFVKKDRHNASVTWQTKYVGEQYVDNTGNPASVFDAYSFTDLQFQYAFNWGDKGRQVAVNFIIRNLFDAKYETNAWNYRFNSDGYDPTPDDPYAVSEGDGFYHLRGFFPQAGTNFLAGVTLTL